MQGREDSIGRKMIPPTETSRVSHTLPSSPPPPPPPITNPRHLQDLYIRTSWVDASLALDQLHKGRIQGGRTTLWIRARLQSRLASLGRTLHCHAGKVLFVALLLLTTFCVGLKSAQLHTRVDQLWIEEGGRLESELLYTRQAVAGGAVGGSVAGTHQLVVQATRDPAAPVLTPRALLAHTTAIVKATQVTVHMYDVTWRLRDLCYSPNVPNFDAHYIDQIFERVIPCAIITPLDCFWEGSKLLGPDYPVTIPGLGSNPIQWTQLNPQTLMEDMKKRDFQFPFSTLESYMKRAGISTGYQEKPCLDPTDPACPATAPNKKSQHPPDIAAELTGGCYGFAAKYMHWPEELIVGGGTHNKSGQLRKAKALQTVVQLMNERELYDYWVDNYRVHHAGWTQEKAAAVLDAWQRKFSDEIQKFMSAESENKSYDFFAFSTATLNDILGKYTRISIPKIGIGYVCILLYVAVSLMQCNNSVKSQAGVGIAGVLLLSVTVTAGLGFCSLLGIPFNASTMQIIPFLALGLGVDDMFLLTHSYASSSCNDGEDCNQKTPAVLRTTGLSVLITSLCNICAFFAAALIPIPALRVFSLQAAILLLFNLASMLLVYPAMISLDIRRRSAQRSDILCCILPNLDLEAPVPKQNKPPKNVKSSKSKMVEDGFPIQKMQTITTVLDKQDRWYDSSKEPLDPKSELQHYEEPSCFSFSLAKLARNYYAPFIMKPSVKVFSMLGLIVIVIASLWGTTKVNDGLELTDIVPQDTPEHKFLSIQGKYFGFYNMYAVTQGDFEYPTNQKLLYDYHEAFVRIPSIIKNDNGGLPDFWLSLFRDWLIELQKAFDRDYSKRYITQEGWSANATDEGILAYKLLVQTGYVDNPIDKTLVSQARLVDGDGIINPKAFYNYLSAWASNDAFAYGASQANLKPEPKAWFHLRNDFELKIPKSLPLVYTQLPFYLHGLSDTENIKTMISGVRAICERFEVKGLANYPSGIPFIFWEQYLHLRPCLGLALTCALAAVLFIIGILLLNVWAAVLVIITLIAMVLQLLGAMSLLGIKLSAIPAVLLIVAVGIGVHFTVHICFSFITSIGSRDRRIRLALEHMFAPVVHGALTSLLAVVMLATSDFNFITRYFFSILLTLILIGLANGLLFFPILLSLIGPAAEVVPVEYPNRISTPSPENSPVRPRRVSAAPAHPRQRPPSLTTITEEPPSCHSSHSNHSSLQSIIVQPEVVVETTTYNTDGSSSTDRSTPTKQSGGITTKVTATANIKVEVHTPMSSSDRCHSRRGYYRDHYNRDRDSRERDRDKDKHRDRDSSYKESSRERRDKDRYRDNHRENGRDSGHESDTSRH